MTEFKKYETHIDWSKLPEPDFSMVEDIAKQVAGMQRKMEVATGITSASMGEPPEPLTIEKLRSAMYLMDAPMPSKIELYVNGWSDFDTMRKYFCGASHSTDPTLRFDGTPIEIDERVSPGLVHVHKDGKLVSVLRLDEMP